MGPSRYLMYSSLADDGRIDRPQTAYTVCPCRGADCENTQLLAAKMHLQARQRGQIPHCRVFIIATTA